MSNLKPRPTEVANFLDSNAKKMLEDIDFAEGQIDEFIEIMRDRFKQSSEHGYAVTLAKMFELKTDLFTKRTNILKMLSSDRGIDIGASKKTVSSFQFNDILSGASISGMVAQGIPNGALPGFYEPIKEVSTINTSEKHVEFDIVDPKEDLGFESESLGGDIEESTMKLMANVLPTQN